MNVLGLACLTLVGLLQAQEKPAPSIEPDGESGAPSISDDGRFIVFESRASNFVAGDQPDSWDVFLFDRESGEVARISDAAPLDARLPQISGDGRWLVFLQAQPEQMVTGPYWALGKMRRPWNVGLHERATGVVRWVGVSGPTDANYQLDPPSITRDGSRVVFGALEGSFRVVRLWDRATDKLEVANLSHDERLPSEDAYDPWISRSGRFLVFSTPCMSMAVRPKTAGLESTVFGFSGDQVLIRDLEARTTNFASHLAYFEINNPHFTRARSSDDGRFVAYNHEDSRVLGSEHVGFVSDLKLERGGRLLPTPAPEESWWQSGIPEASWWQSAMTITWLCAEGRFALVDCTGLPDRPKPWERVPHQIYVRELESGTWQCLTLAGGGQLANGHCDQAVASADLSVIAYRSSATNLVDDDADIAIPDVFVLDRKRASTLRIAPRPR